MFYTLILKRKSVLSKLKQTANFMKTNSGFVHSRLGFPSDGQDSNP